MAWRVPRWNYPNIRFALPAFVFPPVPPNSLSTPEPIKDWSLTTLKEKLIKIGAKIVSHGRYVAFQMAEVGAPRRREEEICESPLSSLAAQEMRVGPSGSDCRIRVQTATSRSSITAGVVSVDGKGGWNPSGVYREGERE